MAITKDQKKEILQELIDKFTKTKNVVFSDYRGLDIASISNLRSQLREKGAETKVAKKTLIKLAAKESNIEDLGDDVMEGPVSATFSYEDEMAGLKVLFKFSKENENLKLLGGIINGKVVGADEIIQLAKLPSKEELYAKLMGSMSSPVSGFVGILSNVMSGFVRALGAYKDTLPAEEAPAPAEEKPVPTEAEGKEEPKAEEPKVEDQTPEPEAETSDQPAEDTDKPADTTESEEPDEEGETSDQPEIAESDEDSSEEEDDLGEAANEDREKSAPDADTEEKAA